ncbi:hypothetical protein F2P79_001163 [Pimephales promelas]|nr:hypothetical protein F2P79_001163 [Pimephales promelas]
MEEKHIRDKFQTGPFSSVSTKEQETVFKMAFIKEETEDISIAEQFRVKNEDAEDHTDGRHSQQFLNRARKCDKIGSVDDTSLSSSPLSK